MKRNHQRGSALIFALILLLVLSAMAGSLMFLSRSETWSSMNYRMMTQARYGAEAGVNATANFIMNAYVPPADLSGTAGLQNFPGFNVNTYPVTDAAGNPIFLSTLNGQAANYPGPAQAAFVNAMNANQPLQAGANTVNYSASAQLMTMISTTPFGTTTPVTIQTWKITAHGDIANVRNAEAEVVTTLERYISPAFGYAAFADGAGCGQLSFTGNGTTNSYDSAGLIPNGGAINPGANGAGIPLNGFGGNVGTNGNESDSGANVQINGSLSTPNSGTGVCGAGNVTAFSGNVNQVTGGFIQLSQPVTFPPPATYPPGATNINATATISPGSAQCTPAVAPAGACGLGDISLSGNKVLTLTPGVYNINSISITGNGQLLVAPYPAGSPNAGQYGPVVINVAGNNNATPIDLEGNGIGNPTFNPSDLQITYAGNGQMKIAGNGASAAVVYAPNATASFKGNGTFYGSVIANQLTDVGNGAVYYDMHLKKSLFTVGNYVLNSFTWNKY
ncbi:MAG TPA: PilX N-terminal domain-containing pilus assembly protein [Candidatus Acidoferrum sp.]|nr:PilX N-terminal domain-containing pilus assembly protein [Candidatus Acidoferrum sp.]